MYVIDNRYTKEREFQGKVGIISHTRVLIWITMRSKDNIEPDCPFDPPTPPDNHRENTAPDSGLHHMAETCVRPSYH